MSHHLLLLALSQCGFGFYGWRYRLLVGGKVHRVDAGFR